MGTSHGVAELIYTDNTGDTPQKRSTIIKIDVDVREDQTINRFVKKISDKPLTWSQANEEASNNNLNYDTLLMAGLAATYLGPWIATSTIMIQRQFI